MYNNKNRLPDFLTRTIGGMGNFPPQEMKPFSGQYPRQQLRKHRLILTAGKKARHQLQES